MGVYWLPRMVAVDGCSNIIDILALINSIFFHFAFVDFHSVLIFVMYISTSLLNISFLSLSL